MHEVHNKRKSADEAVCQTQFHFLTRPADAHVTAPHHPYRPTPPPDTVVVHNTPTRSKYPCCIGCLTAICLCCAIQECCSTT